ncbi:MAG: hypothetical protein H0T79_02200 [Deltaproteobacteria bacterium]|nr:hypothetical protein [Deltaproteobacteria bacterium]
MRNALVLTTALALPACSITDFDIEQPLLEQHVAGSGIPAPLAALFPLPLNLDLSAKIKEQTTGPIDSITLSALSLSITATDQPSGDTDDWSFVEEIHVFASGKSGSSLPRVEIASAVLAGAVTTIDFTVVPGINLKPYVDEGSIVEGTGKGTVPTDDVSYDGTSTFTIHPL